MGQIVITGGNQEIGLFLAKMHLKKQDEVWICIKYIGIEFMQLASDNPDHIHLCRCDTGDTKSVRETFQFIGRHTDKIDVLYNLPSEEKETDSLGLADMKQCITIYNANALGILRIFQQSAPLVSKGTVFINAIVEYKSTERECYGYGMANAAVILASKNYFNEYWEKGMYLFCVCIENTERDTLTPENNTDKIVAKIIEIVENPENFPNGQVID